MSNANSQVVLTDPFINENTPTKRLNRYVWFATIDSGSFTGVNSR
jgi:hypothetical protein